MLESHGHKLINEEIEYVDCVVRESQLIVLNDCNIKIKKIINFTAKRNASVA
jgi:hypothetical protein